MLSSCAYRPIAFDRDQTFIGVFKSNQKVKGPCSFEEIEGVGLKVGWSILGLGYFNRKVITINSEDTNSICSNKYLTVYLNKCALEKSCIVN